MNKYYAANKEKYKARSKAWKEANRERSTQLAREGAARRRAQDPEKFRQQRWRQTGLPMPTRPRPDACENCEREAWLEMTALRLDHDHTTGVFRGWLCQSCNVGLGLLGDSREGLLRALAYLDRAK